jgi:hemoglobin-like flavoprotein
MMYGLLIFVGLLSFWMLYRNTGEQQLESHYVQEEVDTAPLSPEQIKLIQDSWALVLPIKVKAAELFYARLFELDPTAKALFKGKLDFQGDKLMTTISVVVDSLNDLESVVPILYAMGKRHIIYKVRAEQYDIVGAAFLWVLEQGLGDLFTKETKEAWTIAYGIIASVMLEAYSESDLD